MADITGDNDPNTLPGTPDDDTITGLGGDDVLEGGEGDDTLSGGDGTDTLEGGAGDDLLLGGLGNDTIHGGDGIDTVSYEDISVVNGIGVGVYLLRPENQNRSQGDGGFDFITGVENVIGSQISDTLDGDHGDNVLTGLGGDDLLIGEGGDDTLDGGAGEDFLRGRDGDDIMLGGADNDFLQGGEGNDIFDGGEGFDRASMGPGIATDSQTGATVDLAIEGPQNTGHGMDTFISVEHVSGSQYNDTFYGNAGDNWLWGIGGVDYMDGRDGNDLIEVGQGIATVLGGEGTDTLSFSSNSAFPGGVTISLLLQGSQQAIAGGSVTLTGFENLSGSLGIDYLTGDGGANILAGHDGNDVLDGGAGNDTLYGDGAIRMVSSQGGSGPITVIDDQSTFYSNHPQVGNDTLIGGEGDDTLVGGGGDDLLLGGLGNDNIQGGDGIDTVSYEDISVVNGIGVGVYLLRPDNVNRSQGDGGFDLITGVENVIGSQLSDTLDGDHGDNVLTGLGGNDLLIGEGGDDTLDGGAGEDFLRGRDGDDIMLGGADNDFLSGGEGNDTFDGGDGIDRASMFLIATDPQFGVTVDLTITGQQDTGHGLDTFISIEHVSGTNFADTLTGDSLDNWLWGIGGGDTLNGGDGNDLLETGSAGDNVLNGGAGIDTASFFNNNDFTSGVVASLLLQGVAQATSGGTVTLTGIENLSGSTFNDVLTGDAGNNVLAGAEGADELIGGEGDDTLYGDGIVWMTSDQGGSGPITFTPDLDALGIGAVPGDDILRGGAGSDILEGGAGDDLLLGGLGNDIIHGGDGIDTVSYEDISVANGIGVGVYLLRPENQNRSQGDGGFDIITGVENVIGSQISDTLDGDHGDNVLTGLGGDDLLIGEGGDDTLDGGAGEDFLRGRDGDDIMLGGADNDFLSGGEGDDIADGGDGYDRVSMGLSLPTDAQVGATVDLTIAGPQDTGHGMDTFISIEHVSGTTFADSLTGDAGDNWLWGVGGGDTLNGGEGNDNLETGSAGNNVLNGGDGIDTANFYNNNDFTSGVVASLLLQGVAQATSGGTVTLTGIENLSGSAFNDVLTGDAGGNVLAGNSGADTLDGGEGDDILLGDGAIRMTSSQGGSGPITQIEDVATFFNNPSNSGNDILRGGAGSDTLIGGGGDDLLLGGLGNDTINGGDGIDTVSYEDISVANGIGVGVYLLRPENVNRSQGDGGADILIGIENVIGSQISDTLDGDHGDNVLTGLGGDDLLIGEGGDDTLDGGAGEDFLRGRDGDDIMLGGADNDFLSGGEGNDTFDGGEGFDRASMYLSLATDIQTGATVDLAIEGPQDTGHGLDTFISVEHVSGTTFADTFYGNSGDNWLWGAGGGDTLDGRDGNDLLEAGVGANTLIGGDGIDTVRLFDNNVAPMNVTVSLELQGAAQDTGAGMMTLTGIENLAGTAGTDSLTGDDGANTLAGAQGEDTLVGGGGNDLLLGDGDIRMVSNQGGSGPIMVIDNLATFYENPAYVAADVLDGGAGDDRIVGGGGNDLIDGGADVDTAVYSGARADYDVVYSGGQLTITDLRDGAPDGVDQVVNVEFFAFSDGVVSFGELSGLSPDANDDLLQTTVGQASSIDASVLLLNDTFAPEDTSSGEITGVFGADGVTVELVDGKLVIVAGASGGSFNYTVAGDFGSSTGHVTVAAVATTPGNDAVSPTGAPVAVDFHGQGGGDTLTGTDNPDHLVGDSGNDVLIGGAGADVMEGGAQNDIYYVDDAGDAVIEAAGEGDDLVISSISYTLGANVERLTGTGAAAFLGGNELDNILIGTDGDNVLDGHAGADQMKGGLGNDTYHVDDVGDVIVDTGGMDTVITTLNVYTLSPATIESLVFNGTGDFYGTGNSVANTMTGGDGNDRLDGLGGNDTMSGGLGDDTYVVGQAGDLVIEAGRSGIDTVETSINYTLAANVEILRGLGSANLALTGNELNNQIFGNSGNNSINGGLGDDEMAGGLGNDTYYVDSAGDVAIEEDGEGDDLVISSLSHNLASNIERLTLTGSAEFAGGNELNNILTGTSGNNTLDGRGGADIMRGGLGDDTYYVDDLGDVVEDSGGLDTVITSLNTYALASAGVEVLTFNGSGDFNGSGNVLNNTLIGGDGNDRLDGLGGNDTLIGGLGDDTYVVSQTGDVVIEFDGEGLDTVETSINFTLDSFLEVLRGVGTGNLILTGNDADNAIFGNAGNNIINGGLGADQMAGGQGNDTYTVDNIGDTVTEAAGEGTLDTVNAYVDYTLSAEVERLVLLGSAVSGTGNAQANTIVGNSLDNILDGGAGADVMQGGLGNDTYYVDNVGDVVSDSGAGIDLVYTTLGSYTLNAALENLTFIGSGNFTGTGNVLANVLVGGAGNDTLLGLDGNDTLDGGLGADVLNGGAGNDTYVVDNAGDSIVDSAGIDTVMTTLASYTLSATIENLVYAGAGGFSGTGNGLANTLTGGANDDILNGLGGNDILNGGGGIDTLIGDAGNDLLDGGLGADTMSGGVGNDTYVVDDIGDVVNEANNAGTDTIRTTLASLTLVANVEALTYIGSDAFFGTGNDLINTITGADGDDTLDGGIGDDKLFGGSGIDTLIGGQGNDTLDGGAGVDIMDGGVGNDIYIVDDLADVIIETANSGTSDKVRTSLDSYTLGDHLEGLAYTGSGAFTGTGNGLANAMAGGNGADTFYGMGGGDDIRAGAGDDTIYGGDANDKLYGEAGNDVLFGENGNDYFYGGAGADTQTGGAGTDYFVLTALSDSGVGAGLRDVITDFDSADFLDLRLIDANTGAGGNQAFNFIGTAAFSNVAGQLRYSYDGADTHVFGDVNGDGVADFEVLLNGSVTLNAGDFLL